MRQLGVLPVMTGVLLVGGVEGVQAQSSLFLAYPPPNHETQAERIFLIGTAPPQGEVLINGEVVARSQDGHFAPSFPLQLGENQFTLRYGDEQQTITITRVKSQPQLNENGLAPDSLTPQRNIARLPEERICFRAMAAPNAEVSVTLGDSTLPLTPQPDSTLLPSNLAVLTAENDPTPLQSALDYQGCLQVSQPGNLGTATFNIVTGNERRAMEGGAVSILSPANLEVVEVTAASGVARTGPGTSYSRLTPLPQGSRATVTGREGDWLRLRYGAWIRENETRLLPGAAPVTSTIRSILARQQEGATEVVFPLEFPVPVSVQQRDRSFTLTLHNITAQTDTIWLDDDPLIRRLDWEQVTPETINYTFQLKSDQQWGYDLRYEGSSLILRLDHPPETQAGNLQGLRIVLDPGHGGEELGARGPNGYPEKSVNLAVSRLLQQELEQRGATVYLTRETDRELGLRERMDYIAEVNPDLAFSVHYNALPDDGDAMNTAGVGMFWYHPQAHDLAVFLHNYLVENLERPSYGVFWNNLALTRPHAAPTVLMELGFMINPREFEWITREEEQERLADALASGITEWVNRR
ncbi:N-acetylmuramoyl-L-alanine amidase [Spirulina sp. CS-785/01]|uniref:N-acetylmuramoyl-L-alanine amidase n=1 Tax=Spirulina sp. CS-785/01 TaxID=3021716 RepID=UPI003FA77D7D